MTTKKGRKPLDIESKKSRKITIAFTLSDHELLATRAEQLDRPLADFIRDSAIGRPLLIVPPLNRTHWVELSKLYSALYPMLDEIANFDRRGWLIDDMIRSCTPLIEQLKTALISTSRALDEAKDLVAPDSQ